MRLAAVITSVASVQRILGHLQLPTSPISLAGPYTLGFDEMGFDITGQQFEQANQWDGVDGIDALDAPNHWDGVDVVDVPGPDG